MMVLCFPSKKCHDWGSQTSRRTGRDHLFGLADVEICRSMSRCRDVAVDLSEVYLSKCQWIGLRENFNRKALYLMGKSLVSGVDFPLNQSIENYFGEFSYQVGYPLVNVYITTWKDPPCYQWVNPLFQWAIFNSYVS